MAEVLAPRLRSAESPPAASAWWPSDLVIVVYLTALAGLIAAWRSRIPSAWWFIGLHAAGVAAIAGGLRWERVSRYACCGFRYWYPFPYIVACYREMSVLIPHIRGEGLDVPLARIDYALWGVHPTVWLERIQMPALTEFLQVVYTLFIPAVLLVALLVWIKQRDYFPYHAFLVSLGFLASYAGYLLVPARGPRFLLASLQHAPLEGLWLSAALRNTLDVLESAHYDCFPSGHTEMILISCWASRQISPNLFRIFLVYSMCMIAATVYLRYHYTIDVIAGAVLAAGLLAAGPRLFRWTRAVIGPS